MTFPTPPVPPRAEDFARALLDSARQDQVPDDSRRRVALALGIAPGVPLGGGLEPERAASAGRSGAPAPAVIAPAPSKLALLGKSALVGLAAGAVALGAAVFAGSSPRVVATTPGMASPTPLPSALASPDAVPELDVPSQPVSAAASALSKEHTLPNVAPRPPAVARRRSAKPSPSTAKGSEKASAVATDGAESRLLAEVRVLDAARDALAAGNARQALAELERYHREFSDGTLALDATMLEVRALERAGQRAAAHRQARQLLARPGARHHHAELEAIVNPLASGSTVRRRDIDPAR